MGDDQKKIFVADDDPGIQDALRMMLEFAGYFPIVLADKPLIDQIYETSPHAILLDISLSGEDGRDIARQLKKDQNLMHIPIILLSANSDLETIAQSIEVDDYLAKPFDMNNLLALLEKHVS